MNKNNKHTIIFYFFKKALGITLIIIGIPGLFLPLIPGIFLIILGIVLIGNRTLLEKLKQLKNHLKEKNFKA
jgi:hypothetical protein